MTTRLAETRFRPTPPHFVLDAHAIVSIGAATGGECEEHAGIPDENNFRPAVLPELCQGQLSSLAGHPPIIAEAADPVSRKERLDQVEHRRPCMPR